MQKLTIKTRDADGNEVLRTVQVLRAWHDASGRHIYLHHNGVYGYKDGSPVRSPDEFAVMGNSRHRNLAMTWWEKTGKALSRRHYSEVEEQIRARTADFTPVEPDDATEFDGVLYRWRQRGKKNAKWEGPCGWMERFERRPDWWGQAEYLVLAGVEYQKATAGDDSGEKVSPDEV